MSSALNYAVIIPRYDIGQEILPVLCANFVFFVVFSKNEPLLIKIKFEMVKLKMCN